MQVIRRLRAAFLIFVMAPLVWPAMFAAQAQSQAVGQPHDWYMGMQKAYGPVKSRIDSLNNLVLWIIIIITVFVAALLLYVIWRFNAKRNPVPSRTTHNTVLEITWTVVPVLILVFIAIPSFRLIYYENRTADPDLTIKVTGHQWYWEYTYPTQKIDFSSYFVPTNQLKPGQLRLLTVDNELVIPVNKNIRVLTTSGDVIHSFFIPSLGVQRYAIPGRTIETWMRASRVGTFYGECNQICGTNHSRMPIVVHAVTEKQFQAWVQQAQKKFAEATPDTAPAQSHPTRIAAASLVNTVSVER